MQRFTLTRAAKKDLRGIAQFTEERWGYQQTKHYLKGMDDAFQRLADNPMLGSACDYVDIGLRKQPYQSHMIYYELKTENAIRVVRILHKRMDVRRAFTDI